MRSHDDFVRGPPTVFTESARDLIREHDFAPHSCLRRHRADTTILSISPELRPAMDRKFKILCFPRRTVFSARRAPKTQQSSLSQFAFLPARAEVGRSSWKYSLPLW